MAFGQSTGPSAGHAQLKELQDLLERAGYSTYRDARGPYQLNQRQGAGKFTKDEADELIDRLRAELGEEPDPAPAPKAKAATAKTTAKATAKTAAAAPPGSRLVEQLKAVPEELLVAELRRRGWTATAPETF